MLADNLSRLQRRITPYLLREGKPLVETTERDQDDEEGLFFLDQHYSGVIDDDIFHIMEC